MTKHTAPFPEPNYGIIQLVAGLYAHTIPEYFENVKKCDGSKLVASCAKIGLDFDNKEIHLSL